MCGWSWECKKARTEKKEVLDARRWKPHWRYTKMLEGFPFLKSGISPRLLQLKNHQHVEWDMCDLERGSYFLRCSYFSVQPDFVSATIDRSLIYMQTKNVSKKNLVSKLAGQIPCSTKAVKVMSSRDISARSMDAYDRGLMFGGPRRIQEGLAQRRSSHQYCRDFNVKIITFYETIIKNERIDVATHCFGTTHEFCLFTCLKYIFCGKVMNFIMSWILSAEVIHVLDF